MVAECGFDLGDCGADGSASNGMNLTYFVHTAWTKHPDGYVDISAVAGFDYIVLEDVDDCQPDTCPPTSNCIDQFGLDPVCVCKPDFVGDGFSCVMEKKAWSAAVSNNVNFKLEFLDRLDHGLRVAEIQMYDNEECSGYPIYAPQALMSLPPPSHCDLPAVTEACFDDGKCPYESWPGDGFCDSSCNIPE